MEGYYGQPAPSAQSYYPPPTSISVPPNNYQQPPYTQSHAHSRPQQPSQHGYYQPPQQGYQQPPSQPTQPHYGVPPPSQPIYGHPVTATAAVSMPPQSYPYQQHTSHPPSHTQPTYQQHTGYQQPPSSSHGHGHSQHGHVQHHTQSTHQQHPPSHHQQHGYGQHPPPQPSSYPPQHGYQQPYAHPPAAPPPHHSHVHPPSHHQQHHTHHTSLPVDDATLQLQREMAAVEAELKAIQDQEMAQARKQQQIKQQQQAQQAQQQQSQRAHAAHQQQYQQAQIRAQQMAAQQRQQQQFQQQQQQQLQQQQLQQQHQYQQQQQPPPQPQPIQHIATRKTPAGTRAPPPPPAKVRRDSDSDDDSYDLEDEDDDFDKPRKSKNSDKTQHRRAKSASSKPMVMAPSALDRDKSGIDKLLAWRYLPNVTDPGKVEVPDHSDKECLVLYKGQSYLHVKWIPIATLMAQGDQYMKTKIARFLKTNTLPCLDEETIFNADYCEVDRILASRPLNDGTDRHEYLIKWQSLPYANATWELPDVFKDNSKINDFIRFNQAPAQLEYPIRPGPERFQKLTVSPIYKNQHELRPWQIDGVSWLLFNWYNRRGCILADEMGLGKTAQCVATIQHMVDVYSRGPYLCIVPLSTIAHWKREFEAWTDLNVIVYQGTKADRDMIRLYEFHYWDSSGQEMYPTMPKFNVLIATPESVLYEAQQLKEYPWRCICVDEAHRLKNKESKLFKTAKTFTTEHRILLTGTPIQNNMEELWTLLNYIDPQQFPSSTQFMTEYGNMTDQDQVQRLQAKLAPYLLRRMKEDVAKKIPPKEETIIEVELTLLQKKYYRAVLEKNRGFLYKGCAGGNVPRLINVVMQLRKVCNHPFLLAGVQEKETQGLTTQKELLDTLVASSGKLVLVDKLLPKLQAGGHKVLIFSQLKLVLDLLENYMKLKQYPYERIDGTIRGNDRQAAIDRFSRPGSDRFVFLLSTRAGGLGINLTTADTVIIYDSDWNPQNDMQAQARCHRIGQTQTVTVYRLLASRTYEKEMFHRASMKLGLDQAVLKKMKQNAAAASSADAGGDDAASQVLSKWNKNEIESLLKYGAYDLFNEDADKASSAFCEEDIDQILSKRTTVFKSGGGTKPDEKGMEASPFAKATFSSSTSDSAVDVNAPDFWAQVIPDNKSPSALLSRLQSGEVCATPESKAEFLSDLHLHVTDIISSHQQGISPEHMNLVLHTLAQIYNSTDDSQFTPTERYQCHEWIQEIERPRRNRGKGTDSKNKIRAAPPVASSVLSGATALPNRKEFATVNGMGGTIWNRMERDALAKAMIDLVGVLWQTNHPDPPPPPTLHVKEKKKSGAQPSPAAAAPSVVALHIAPEWSRPDIWQEIRAKAKMKHRPLSEVIAYGLAFLDLCATQAEPLHDSPIFQQCRLRMQSAVPHNLSEIEDHEAMEMEVRLLEAKLAQEEETARTEVETAKSGPESEEQPIVEENVDETASQSVKEETEAMEEEGVKQEEEIKPESVEETGTEETATSEETATEDIQPKEEPATETAEAEPTTTDGDVTMENAETAPEASPEAETTEETAPSEAVAETEQSETVAEAEPSTEPVAEAEAESTEQAEAAPEASPEAESEPVAEPAAEAEPEAETGSEAAPESSEEVNGDDTVKEEASTMEDDDGVKQEQTTITIQADDGSTIKSTPTMTSKMAPGSPSSNSLAAPPSPTPSASPAPPSPRPDAIKLPAEPSPFGPPSPTSLSTFHAKVSSLFPSLPPAHLFSYDRPDPRAARIDMFPSLTLDKTFVKHIQKRTRRWAKWIIITQAVCAELDAHRKEKIRAAKQRSAQAAQAQKQAKRRGTAYSSEPIPPLLWESADQGPLGIYHDLPIPTSAERPPVWWWAPEDDRNVLVGIGRHGWGFEWIRNDSTLIFLRKLGPAWQEKPPNEAAAGVSQLMMGDHDDDAMVTLTNGSRVDLGCLCLDEKECSHKPIVIRCSSCHCWYHTTCVAAPPTGPLLEAAQKAVNAPIPKHNVPAPTPAPAYVAPVKTISAKRAAHLARLNQSRAAKRASEGKFPKVKREPTALKLAQANLNSSTSSSYASSSFPSTSASTSLNPYGQAAPQQANPYGQTPTSANPYQQAPASTPSPAPTSTPQLSNDHDLNLNGTSMEADDDSMSEPEMPPTPAHSTLQPPAARSTPAPSPSPAPTPSPAPSPSPTPTPVPTGPVTNTWVCDRCNKAWPVLKSIEMRLRVVVETMTKTRKVSSKEKEKAQRQFDKDEAKRKKQEEGNSQWSKREKAEFMKGLLMYGAGQWQRIGERPGLGRKTIEALMSYYDRLTTQCDDLMDNKRRHDHVRSLQHKQRILLDRQAQLEGLKKKVDELRALKAKQRAAQAGKKEKQKSSSKSSNGTERPAELQHFPGAALADPTFKLVRPPNMPPDVVPGDRPRVRFPMMDDEDKVLSTCKFIINDLMKNPKGTPFMNPVDPEALGIRDYWTVVKRPMDLSTIRSNLNRGAYHHPKAFEDDVKLVWTNCKLYNLPTSPIAQTMLELSQRFDKLYGNKIAENVRTKLSAPARRAGVTEAQAALPALTPAQAAAAAVASSKAKSREEGSDSEDENAAPRPESPDKYNDGRAELAIVRAKLAKLQPLLQEAQKAQAPSGETVDDSLTPGMAMKIIQRVKLLSRIRDCLTKPTEQIRKTLSTMNKRNMPSWYAPSVHDHVMLYGVASHGCGAVEEILRDPNLADTLKPVAGRGTVEEAMTFWNDFLQDGKPLNERLILATNMILYGKDKSDGLANDDDLEPLTDDIDISKELAALGPRAPPPPAAAPPSTSPPATPATTTASKKRRRSTDSNMEEEEKPRAVVPVSLNGLPAPPPSKRHKPIKNLPRDAHGKPILPIQIKGGASILTLGTIVVDRKAFHKGRVVYPVGYTSQRYYQSMTDPNVRVVYTSQILDGGSGPIFTVVADDNPGHVFSSPTPTAAWCEVLKVIDSQRDVKRTKVTVSGPEMFGFAHPTIRQLIEELPGFEEVMAQEMEDQKTASTKKKPAKRSTSTKEKGDGSAEKPKSKKPKKKKSKKNSDDEADEDGDDTDDEQPKRVPPPPPMQARPSHPSVPPTNHPYAAHPHTQQHPHAQRPPQPHPSHPHPSHPHPSHPQAQRPPHAGPPHGHPYATHPHHGHPHSLPPGYPLHPAYAQHYAQQQPARPPPSNVPGDNDSDEDDDSDEDSPPELE